MDDPRGGVRGVIPDQQKYWWDMDVVILKSFAEPEHEWGSGGRGASPKVYTRPSHGDFKKDFFSSLFY